MATGSDFFNVFPVCFNTNFVTFGADFTIIGFATCLAANFVVLYESFADCPTTTKTTFFDAPRVFDAALFFLSCAFAVRDSAIKQRPIKMALIANLYIGFIVSVAVERIVEEQSETGKSRESLDQV